MQWIGSRLVRGLSVAVVSMVLGGAAQAQPAADLQTVQWRDLRFQLSADWHKVSPDPDKNSDGRRILYDRVEALHSLRVTVRPLDAPTALAPSEVAAAYIENQKKTTSETGTLSDWKSGRRSIGGQDYPFVAVRFTPESGPPVLDQHITLVFPSDYADRQRWYVIQWLDNHSGTAPPKPLDELDGIVSSMGLRPLGTVLLADDFSDADNGALKSAMSTDHYTVGYMDGEFAIQKTDAEWKSLYIAGLPGTYADASLDVDTYVPTDEFGPSTYLYCRRTSAAGSYRAGFDPIRGRAWLNRVKQDGTLDVLAPFTTSAAIQTGTGVNHLELVCRGSLIELDVNGTRVVSARNSDLVEGGVAISGGAFNDTAMLPDIRFAKLQVVQR